MKKSKGKKRGWRFEVRKTKKKTKQKEKNKYIYILGEGIELKREQRERLAGWLSREIKWKIERQITIESYKKMWYIKIIYRKAEQKKGNREDALENVCSFLWN